MRKFGILIGVLAALSMTMVSEAQRPGMGGPGGPGGRQGGGRGMTAMFDELKLNAKQKASAQKVFEEFRPKMRAIFQSGKGFGDPATRKKMDAVRAEMDAKMKKILTPAQFKKMQEMQKARMARFRAGGGRPGARPGAGAPQK